MATRLSSFDLTALKEQVQAQFRNLDPQNPALWPAIPRYALRVAVAVMVVVVLWFAWLSGSDD